MLRSLAKISFGKGIFNCQNRIGSRLPAARLLSSSPRGYDPAFIRNCAIIAHVDHGSSDSSPILLCVEETLKPVPNTPRQNNING
jgi:hypothetical protein